MEDTVPTTFASVGDVNLGYVIMLLKGNDDASAITTTFAIV